MEILDKSKVFEGGIEGAQKEMTKDITDYQATASTMSEEDLLKDEQELMDKFKENDEYIKTVNYELPDDVTFEDKKYSASDVSNKIIYFLNNLESKWETTLGIYQQIRWWKTRKDNKIPYAVLDSALRTLGTCVFKGETELRDILIINNYCSSCSDEYKKDTLWIAYLSQKHNVILTELQKQSKENE